MYVFCYVLNCFLSWVNREKCGSYRWSDYYLYPVKIIAGYIFDFQFKGLINIILLHQTDPTLITKMTRCQQTKMHAACRQTMMQNRKMELFPRVAVINYHILRGLTQEILISSYPWKLQNPKCEINVLEELRSLWRF